MKFFFMLGSFIHWFPFVSFLSYKLKHNIKCNVSHSTLLFDIIHAKLINMSTYRKQEFIKYTLTSFCLTISDKRFL